MKNEIYELLSTVADNNGLQLVQTTIGRNGSPEHISYAITGFEDIEQFKAVKDEVAELYHEFVDEDEEDDKSISDVSLHRRDGWDFWNVNTLPFVEPFEIDDFYAEKDYYQVYSNSDFKDEEQFLEWEVITMVEDCDSFEKLNKLIKEKEELWNKINSLEDGEILVCNTDSKTSEVMKRECMGFYKIRALKTTRSSASWMKERRVLALVFDVMFDCLLADVSDCAYEISVSP